MQEEKFKRYEMNSIRKISFLLHRNVFLIFPLQFLFVRYLLRCHTTKKKTFFIMTRVKSER